MKYMTRYPIYKIVFLCHLIFLCFFMFLFFVSDFSINSSKPNGKPYMTFLLLLFVLCAGQDKYVLCMYVGVKGQFYTIGSFHLYAGVRN